MKRRNVLYVLTVLFALCLLCFVGCNVDTRPTELKSDLGITVSGDRFEPGVELVTTRLKLSDERVREALKKLPEEYFSSDDSEIAAIDIALVSGGKRIQPRGRLRVEVPAPLEGAEDYVVYQVIGDEVKRVAFARFDDGVIRFDTSTFSVFLFRDSTVKRSLTVVVEGPCAGNVKVEIPEFFNSYTKYYLNNGEQQTFDLSGVERAVKLSASSPENYKFIGWYESIDGVTEKEPISTDEWLEYKVKGRRTLVARTEAELSGVSGIWAFPGESNFPVGFGDGRAATQVYVRPGNAQNLDAGKLLIKAYKESEGNGVYINVSPYQYDVEGLNEIDYSKEGDYRVRFVAKENEDLVAEVVVHVSESVANLRAITNGNGAFRVDGGKEKYNDKTFALTDSTDGFELEAERYVEDASFKFKGWYRYLEGGILGEKMSDSEKLTLRGDMGDLTVIALYKTLSAYENLFGVYQLRLFPGESGIPVDESNERGEIESLLYYRPNEAQIDVSKVVVKGLRRAAEGNGYELVDLRPGDYEIDYDGLDFGKEGTYGVKFKAKLQGDESYYVTISISIFKEYAALTVEFDGNGSLKGSIVDPAAGTSYDKKDMTESGTKYVLGAFMRRDYRSIVATPDEGHRFAGWYAVDENGNLSEEPISKDAEYRFTQNGKDEHIKAVFVKEVLAYVYIDRSIGDVNGVIKKGDEIIVKDPDGHPEVMGAGETLTLTAVPNDGYKFSGWYTAHDDEERKFYSANATETFTVLKDVQIYAAFADKNSVTIKAYVSNGYGKISKDLPDGVTAWEDSVEITVKEGDAVQLTARPSYEYVRFVGWFDESTQQSVLISENATETFTVNTDTRLCAKFEEKPYFIAFTEGNGTIKQNGEIASFGNGIHVDKGTQITLTAEPGENSVFVGWFDESARQSVLISENATETFTVNTDTRLCAKFRNKLESIEIMTESNGSYEDAIYKNVELGGQYRPDPEEIPVAGVYKGADQQASLTLGRDYTVDKGGLNYDVRGTYTVTYTVVGQPEVFAKLIIRVLAEGDYYDAWLRLPQNINIAGEDNNGVLIAEFVIGGNPFDLTKATFVAYAIGQQEETTLVYSTDFTIDYGGLDYTKAGRYLVKFIPNGCPELTESIIIAVYNPKTVKYFTEITTADSGFSMDNNYNYSARYKIGDSFRPDPEQVQIYGNYYGEADSHILELGTDYVIDRGNLDYEVPGRYEITFRAVTNPGISLIMVIIVEA